MGKRPKGELELYKFIGQQIKKARKANEPARMDGQNNPSAITQTALGNAIGVTFQQVQKYEKGTNRVPIDKLLLLLITHLIFLYASLYSSFFLVNRIYFSFT